MIYIFTTIRVFIKTAETLLRFSRLFN